MNVFFTKQTILILLLTIFFYYVDTSLQLEHFHAPGQSIAYADGDHGGGDHGGGDHGGGGGNSSGNDGSSGGSGGNDSDHESDSGDAESDSGTDSDGHDGDSGDAGDDYGDHVEHSDTVENNHGQHEDEADSRHNTSKDHSVNNPDEDENVLTHLKNFFTALFSLNGSQDNTDHEPAVLLSVNADQATVDEAINSGLKIEQRLQLKQFNMTITKFRVPAGENEATFSRQLSDHARNQLMFNHYYRLDESLKKSSPDPEFPNSLIGWPAPSASCGQGVRIGMVDSYVNARVPRLYHQRIARQSFTDDARASESGHGTAIASILIGSNGNGFCGLMPGALLFSAAAFSTHISDEPLATTLAIVRSLDWLVTEKVQVINLSFSGPDNDLLRQAVAITLAQSIPIVAAAGNHGKNSRTIYPAAYPGVIGVTAVDQFQHLFRGANQGEYVSFAAPGVRVPVPDAEDRISYKTGTSYAAAYCTAMIAHMQQQIRKIDTETLVAHLKENAVDLGDPGKDPLFGWGLIQYGKGSRSRRQNEKK